MTRTAPLVADAELDTLAAKDASLARALMRKLDEQPGDLRARRALADLLRAGGLSDPAVAQYRALVGAYAAQGQLFKAIAACKDILEVQPDDDAAARTLAELYARRTSGKESAELGPEMGAALQAIDLDDVIDSDDVEPVPPPLPADALSGEGDEEIVDLEAIAAAMTPLPEGAVRIERPAAVPLFSGLSTESFLALLRQLKAWEAEPGALILGEGEQSDGLYVIVRGRVRVERAGKDGAPIVLARLGADSFFGEMSILSKRPRLASVVAEDKTKLLEISRAVLDDLVQKDPGVAQALESFARARLLENLALTSPLLVDLPRETLKSVLDIFGTRRVSSGTTVVEAGKTSSGLFVVMQGELDVLAKADVGTMRLKQLGPGDVFGEMSLMSGDPPSASVVATTDCALLWLSRDELSTFVAVHPVVGERLARIAATRRAFNERFLPDSTSSAALI
jgi:CRP-like cAMP-binding protein